MGQLLVLAALATLSVPVLLGHLITADVIPSPALIAFLILLEIGISTGILKLLYPRNSTGRCLTFGGVLFVVRLLCCLVASFLVPNSDALWTSVAYQWSQALIPTLTIMYASALVTVVQYVSLLLWIPVALERLLPGAFSRASVPLEALPRPTPPAEPAHHPVSAGSATFRALEKEFADYPDLLAWGIFSPEMLPVWLSGKDPLHLETAPEVLLRLNDLCRPLLRPEWDQTLQQGVFQTENGCCLLATLPGNFVFTGLWSTEGGKDISRATLARILERVQKWLQVRFAGLT